jgi:low temperature requirement protein LtrA
MSGGRTVTRAAESQSAGSLLRPRTEQHDARVTTVELFFDLVFVFAITQLSHLLLHDLTLAGAVRTGLLFVAVWWVWIYTSWVTNWLYPNRTLVRLLMFALMLGGLVLSTSIPQAFHERALPFAAAYVLMQVGRSLFMIWALGSDNPRNTRNFQRITLWLMFAGVFWIVGALAHPDARLAWWGLALVIELVSPALGFYVPGLGRSTTEDWDVEGRHLAERCLLFIIIALGESLLVTGASFAQAEWTGPVVAAFATAFVSSVAMWWIYFDIGAERGSRRIAESANPGRLARLAYTYLHIPIIAGIVVSAVADELVLAHPAAHAELRTVATVLGGPLLFLAGNLLFKSVVAGRPPLSHLVGIGVLALLAPGAIALSPLGVAAGATAVLVLVAVWETLSLRSIRAELREP